MADGNPARNLSADRDLVWEFLLNCFRDWCQDQAARFTMRRPGDYDRYTHLTRNLFSGVTPYSQFRPQMSVLLQNYTHLQVYWDVYRHWCMGTLPLVECLQLLYPVRLCVQLRIIPAFIYERLLGEVALRNRSSVRNREQGRQQARQHLELQADDGDLKADDSELKAHDDGEMKADDIDSELKADDDGELQAEDGEQKSEDSERTETDSDGDRL